MIPSTNVHFILCQGWETLKVITPTPHHMEYIPKNQRLLSVVRSISPKQMYSTSSNVYCPDSGCVGPRYVGALCELKWWGNPGDGVVNHVGGRIDGGFLVLYRWWHGRWTPVGEWKWHRPNHLGSGATFPQTLYVKNHKVPDSLSQTS